MNEEFMSVENEGLAQPHNGANEDLAAPQSSETREDVAAPHGAVDIDAMTDDEFDEHLRKLAQGSKVRDAAAENKPPEAASKPEDEGTAKPAEEQKEPFKQFFSQEEYQSEIDRIVSKRFGELQRKNRESLDLLGKLTIQARNFYSDAADDTEAVNRLLGDLTNQNAESRGTTAQEYERQTQDAEDARRFREQQAQEAEQQTRVDAIKQQWADDSMRLREIVPGFDFRKALENNVFRDAISNGKTVFEAYMIVNRKSPASPSDNLHPQGKKPIMQVAQSKGSVAGQTHPDIDKMTDEEFDKYISEHRGE